MKSPEGAVREFQSLQLRVMDKTCMMRLPQLAALRLNPPAPLSLAMRAAHNINDQVNVPYVRTELYLRSFLPHYSRLWNTMICQTDPYLNVSFHILKTQLNVWLQVE